MIIKSKKEEVENQFIPHHINMWYDRHSRNWIVQLMDIYENQIGDAIYSYSKEEAIQNKEDLQEQYNIK